MTWGEIMSSIYSLFRRLTRGNKIESLVDDQWRMEDIISHRNALAERWLTGHGVEIGALHQPVKIPKEVSIEYLDYKTKSENELRYPELKGHKIVDTDIVDDGFICEKLPDHSLNYIVANHALEHSPDPYGTLLKWRSKVKSNGILYFSLPIAEKCFDRGRPITTLEHLLADHKLFTNICTHDIAAVTEAHLREFITISDTAIRVSNGISHLLGEDEIDKACADFMGPLKKAIDRENLCYDDLISAHINYLNRFYDIHYHTFSPTSLYTFIDYFCHHEHCKIMDFRKSGGGECIVVLQVLA